MIRANIQIIGTEEIKDFVATLNHDGTADKYILQNFDGSFTVDARSYLGALYASAEFGDIFLLNLTNDGKFPNGIDKFRK